MSGVRRRSGVNLIGAFIGNYGNLSFRCQGRIPRGGHLKGESTDAENRGGATRTSEEVPVMGMEQRGVGLAGNWTKVQEDTLDTTTRRKP